MRILHVGCFATAVALVAFGMTSDLSAGNKANKRANNANSPFHTILAELHQAHHLLSLANHDYSGHRAKAHQEVGRAIHLLHTHPHHVAHVAKHGKGRPAIHEAQQISDAQMLQAAQNLQTIIGQLTALQSTPLAHPNVNAAGSALQQAIVQINLGLKASPLNK
jgi:hypothetical protein